MHPGAPSPLRVVVLPGLDGTGRLCRDVSLVAPEWLDVEVVAYPTHQALGYEKLQDYVRHQLPSSPFILVGESFSGPLACQLAAEHPPGLQGLMLVATFASTPYPWLGALAPLVRQLVFQEVPLPVADWFLLGSWTTPALREDLRTALRQVNPAVLSHRASATLIVDVTSILSSIRVPVHYLRAGSDRVVRPFCDRHLQRHLPR